MILTCPQCDTRYQADGSKFPAAGRNVRCAKCGHVWHQLGPPPEPDPDAELFVEEPTPPPPPPAPVPAHEPEPVAVQPRVAAFAPPAAEGDVPETVAAPSASRWGGRITVLAGWIALVALILVIGWAGISFRDNVATWVPQTASFYNAAGLAVSPKGIAFTDVAYQNQMEDGQQVLAVTGKIVNRSNHELTVPLVRVALFDAERHELYHWTFVPGVATLQPGGSAKFRTRLSSPPAGTHNLEVRFANGSE
ncbi:MAG: zinc-ribbon domain-containing protein [Alphaproteobacteria bacterium]|nr:zinc-ribbon domain-containing protein [Alphaproteobacteria bacterium]MBL6937478.1 zinc-ribbon domain-containing protein [Alphaproteobacteria bacterium]MBL7098816.1 zinc-ribbon domain-containing protein [Alphaproteobacteria bacterium]